MTENQISASEIVVRHLTEFSKAISFSAYPSVVDGLKPVIRRILVSTRDIDGNFKSLKLVAQTLELHPYGDDSIYNTAIRMGQVFEYNPTMLEFDSACGDYSNPRGADSRYTEERVSEFTKEVFFGGVEYKALPKQMDELLQGYEPVYLAPAIPTALLYANKTIGYGVSSYTVPHNLADVCDLVVLFCRHQKTSPTTMFDYTPHVEKFLPDFPVLGTLTNHRQLLSAYRRGEFTHKILLEGEVELTVDSIHVRTLPYGVPFKGLVGKIEALMSKKGSWFDRNILSVKGLSEEHEIGDVCIKLKRGVNVFEAWDLLSKKISFNNSYTPIPNYNVDGHLAPISQPNLLLAWYNARYNILVSSKKLRITGLTRDLRRVEARLIICDNIDTVVEIIRRNDRETGVRLLQEAFDLTPFQSEYLVATPLTILSKTSKEEMIKRKLELETSIRVLRDSFGKVADEMASEAIAIKKKYTTSRRTRIPAYIGYVRIGGGCIQFSSVDEIARIISSFPKGELEIYMYDGPHLYKVTGEGKLETGSIPKITTGDIYGIAVDPRLSHSDRVVTVNIVDGAACCVQGFVPGLRSEGYFYTTPKSKAISRDGTISTISVTEEISLRKTICRGSASDIIYVYPVPEKEHYVFALNTETPNVITIQRVSPERAKIAMSPTGKIRVSHSTDKHFFLNIPQEFLNRNTTRVVEFIDLDKMLEGKNHSRVNIAETNIKGNKYIRLW